METMQEHVNTDFLFFYPHFVKLLLDIKAGKNKQNIYNSEHRKGQNQQKQTCQL